MSDLRNAGPAGSNLLFATEASTRIASGELRAQDLVADCLARIRARDPRIGAWVSIDEAHALEQARTLDRELERAGPRSALHGIPVGIKDVLDTCDFPTAHGSSIYKGDRPARDSACVTALRRAGAVILGKTATTEFASPWPIGVRNPHDLTRTPGVSSSGSAAAVADFMVPLAIGTQTGGSIIRPATYFGIYGIKASLDGLDRGGIRHLRPSLDTLGLFARSLDDLALMRSAMTGTGNDTRAATAPPRIGVCRTADWLRARKETKRAFGIAEVRLLDAGAELLAIELPRCFDAAMETFTVITAWEGALALERELRDHAATMNPWLREFAAKIATLDSARYEAAKHHAAECRAQLAPVFAQVDVLITPASAGEASQNLTGLEDQSFCPLWTMMHGPALTLPAFTGPHAMPMGLQVVGPVGSDARLIELAGWIDRALSPTPIEIA